MSNPLSPATQNDHHFMRVDRKLHWQRIATAVSEHPENLMIALENIDRWLALGRVHPAPLQEWRERIVSARDSPESFDELIQFLRKPNHDSEPIKSCSPFVGLVFSPKTA